MAHSDHSHTPVQTPVTGIIGASGKTGARINQALRAAGIMTRPLSRQADIPFDWADRSGWPQALAGLDSLYITYAPDLAVPAAEDDIRHLTELARTSGIRHLVLLSGRGEEGAQRAEAQVRNSGLNWNIVRASWFMQNFSESFMLDGVLARQVVLPEVSVTEPFIDVDDIAAVAVAVLPRPELSQQVEGFLQTAPMGWDDVKQPLLDHAIDEVDHCRRAGYRQCQPQQASKPMLHDLRSLCQPNYPDWIYRVGRVG